MSTTPAFIPARPGTGAARWRGPLVLAPLVVALHAAVLFSAWQVVDRRPAAPTATTGAADAAALQRPIAAGVQPAEPTRERPLEQPRELRLVAQALPAGPAPGDGPAPVATPAPVPVPLSAPVLAPVLASARAPMPAPQPAAGARAPEAATPTAQAAAAGPAPDLVALTTPAPTGAAAASGAVASDPGAAPSDTGLAAAAPAPAPGLAPPGASALAPTPTPPAARAPAAMAAPPARPEAAASASVPSLPVYRGEPPPSATMHFTLSRAAISGRGKLSWTQGAEGYELTLQGTVLGMRLLEQTSRGRFDQGSLAPDRFLDSRRGRAARAANFRRDAGLISYSAVEQTYPLVRGAQDRLSWMLQLPAVMQANPALRQVGAELYMFVTGARGDGDVWGFRVMSVDRLSLPWGEVPRALHLQRLPRYEHDTQADIWLDPGRHHLPARVRLQSGDDVLDLVLERLEGG